MRVGIVGSGFMARTHAAAWANTPATLVGVHTLDSSGEEAFVRDFGCQAFNSLQALIDQVDVVDVCTPTYLHMGHVIAAAHAGKHVICEKPIARTLEQGEEMIRICRDAGVQLLIAHVVRFFPEYARAKAIVDSGEIGQVAVVRLSRCGFKPAANIPDSWFHDPEKSGGMMLDLMIHDFDYARWVAGEVESVYARSATGANATAPLDHGLAILRHHNGALSHIEGSWAYPPPLFRTALEIAGSEGLIEHPAGNANAIEMYLRSTESSAQMTGLPRSSLIEDPYTLEMQHFYKVLTEGIVPRVTAEDGLAALRIALAARESARTGNAVQLRG
ncbi:MAG: putative oxidoreductase [Chloroflexi bacterium OLB15]|nr:MAG: putative oxidoreductase [Chloroflexi bacterium OLB15]